MSRNPAQDFGPIAEDVKIAMRPRIAPDLRFFGDRRLITQMVVNLIENAIAHSGASEISLSTERTGRSATISVADNGIGIPAGEYDHVFQRFYRLEERPGSFGFGLGLSLVASIAKMHGIGVSLNDNRPGLRVDLEFPMPASAPRAEAVGAIGRVPTPAGTTPGRAE
jgi:signal transduction histidine kinase